MGVICDGDGDGFLSEECGGDDCSDENPNIHPGAADLNAHGSDFGDPAALFSGFAETGYGTALAVDSSGAVHAVNTAEGLRYANNRTGEFVLEQPDTEARGAGSLVVTESGVVHIAYATADEVRLATRTDEAWAVTSITRADDMRRPADGLVSLARDESGVLHVVYPTDAGIVYRVQQGDQFNEAATVGSPAARPAGFQVLHADQPHLLYAETAEPLGLFYAEACSSGLCTTQLADGQPSARMAVDDSGGVHVVHAGNLDDQHVVYRSRSAQGAWSLEQLAIESYFVLAFAVSLANDEQLLHIIYRDANVTASYAHGTPQNWSLEMVSYSVSDVALALEPEAVAHTTSLEFTFSDSYFVTYRTNRVVRPDGIDQNCDGVDGIDADGDGDASLHSGGGDCNDYRATMTGQAGTNGNGGCQP